MHLSVSAYSHFACGAGVYLSVSANCYLSSGTGMGRTRRFSSRNGGNAALHKGVALTIQPGGPRFPDLRRGGRGDFHGPVAFLQGQALADELFHLVQLLHFVDAAEGDGFAGPAGTAGTADPVDIGFRFHGHVIVEHMAEAGHVDAAGGNVCGDQHP